MVQLLSINLFGFIIQLKGETIQRRSVDHLLKHLFYHSSLFKLSADAYSPFVFVHLICTVIVMAAFVFKLDLVSVLFESHKGNFWV